MPHVAVEYSENLGRRTDIGALLDVVHETLMASQAFPPDAIRTRGVPREQVRIGDCDPRNAFLAIVVRIAPGRSRDTSRTIGRALFDAVCEHLTSVIASVPLSITIEFQEIDQTAAFKASTIGAFS